MIGVTTRQSWLFFQPMAQQVSLLKDDLLDPMDALLADPELVQLVRTCLAGRRPQSTRTGRDGIAPDRLLRCCVLKHLKGWSFRELERELRSNLIYRRFTRFEADVTPDVSTFSRVCALLTPAVTGISPRATVAFLRCERARRRSAWRAKVALPARGPLSKTRAARQKQRWFRRRPARPAAHRRGCARVSK
jgi:hypothetical protein